jgi:hypothetical protein
MTVLGAEAVGDFAVSWDNQVVLLPAHYSLLGGM